MMHGLGWFSFLIVGLIAGWIAEKVTASDHGLLTNLVVGVIGAYVGAFIARLLGIHATGFWGALVIAALGAVLFLYVWRWIRGGPARSV